MGHSHSTNNLCEIAAEPKCNWFTGMKPGDVVNRGGSPVVLFTGYHPDGTRRLRGVRKQSEGSYHRDAVTF